MKTSSTPFPRFFKRGAIATFCLLAVSAFAQAKGPKSHSQGRSHGSNEKKYENYQHSDRGRRAYSSHPRSGFVLSFGNGYAGQGYYYGPPNSPYYYERPEVRYYSNRDAYWRNSREASVQRALAKRGYYTGSYDGQIGPQSRRSIMRYQRDRGFSPTGLITQGLLRSLGL